MLENLKSISIRPPHFPPPVTAACAKLRDAGYKAWLAGGCVRDILLNRPPRDWDVVTNAPLETIRALFPKHLEVGVAFGIVKLVDPSARIDVAIFRRESGYSDLRRPDRVEPGDERSDVARRDFTVNALYLDPFESTVFDLVGGHKDLQRKTLRTVGVAETRFSEDALRVLRAARFSAQLGFRITAPTLKAMKNCGPLLKAISRERVRDETFRIFESRRPITGLEALMKTGLWEQVFGVRKAAIPADYRTLKFGEAPSALGWLCALGVTGLLGDPTREPDEITARLTGLLKLSNDEKRVFARVIRVFADSAAVAPNALTSGSLAASAPDPLDWIELARKERPVLDLARRFIRRARGVDIEQKDAANRLIEQSQRWASRDHAAKTLVPARELLREGFTAGPRLGRELKLRQWRQFWELTI
ncbi:MAG: CCA tRNA nucleotidyltransferase [Deltaproteobacteria bacterium]|nr:CCA tRNA nucleotidyltransferase [Deltaproteobacteria bacterium]